MKKKPTKTIAKNKMSAVKNFSYAYEGANYSPARMYLPADLDKDADSTQTKWVRSRLITAARYIVANVGFAKGIVQDVKRYSVGSGLQRHSLSTDLGWKQAVEEFLTYSDNRVDVTGRFNWNLMQGFIPQLEHVDGDCGFILDGSDPFYGKVQLIEAHRICYEDEANESIVDGVETSNIGQPIAYWVSSGAGSTRIPADSFVHCYEPTRSTATRGMSAFHAAANKIRDNHEILSAETKAVKRNSFMTMVEWNETGAPPPGKSYFGLGASPVAGKDVVTEIAADGETRYIKTGNNIKPWESNRPSATFTGFLDYNESDVLVGFGLPANWKNLHKEGGATLRAAMAKAQRRFDEVTENVATICRRIDVWRIAKASKPGGPIAGVRPADWWRMGYDGSAKLTSDAGRENREDRLDVLAGLLSPQEYYARFQQKMEDEYAKVGQASRLRFSIAAAIAKEFGCSIEYAMANTFERGNGNIIPGAANPIQDKQGGATP